VVDFLLGEYGHCILTLKGEWCNLYATKSLLTALLELLAVDVIDLDLAVIADHPERTRSGGGTKTWIDCGARALTCLLVISLQPRSRLGAARGRL
jgi:hypothetical protein